MKCFEIELENTLFKLISVLKLSTVNNGNGAIYIYTIYERQVLLFVSLSRSTHTCA